MSSVSGGRSVGIVHLRTKGHSSSSSFIPTRAEWTPFQIHCYSENLVAPGIEPGISGSAARNSDLQNVTGLKHVDNYMLLRL
jgi:hypothetical protein